MPNVIIDESKTYLFIFPRSDRVHLSLYQVNVPIEREEDWPQIPIAAFPTELCGTISLRLAEFTGKRQILRVIGIGEKICDNLKAIIVPRFCNCSERIKNDI